MKRENLAIKGRINRDKRNISEYEEDYYKSVGLSNFWSNNNIKYEIMVIETKCYHLKNILIKLDHKCNTWKTQLTIAVNFF